MSLFENQRVDFGGYRFIAGVDEAGRGPLAGPVVVAAVILKPDAFHEALNDSKKLSEKKREALYDWVIDNSLAYSIKTVKPNVIDEINILNATLLGMKTSVENLKVKPEITLFDGNKAPVTTDCICKAIVKGDSKYACIAAASILAKVTRDRIMIELDEVYPEYGFKVHKGYPTKKHVEMIKKYGATKEHRMSFNHG